VRVTNAAAVEALKTKADKFAQDVMPIIDDIRAGGITSLRGISIELKRGILTAFGHQWYPTTVRSLLARVKA